MHIDLAGSYMASMDGFHYLTMFVDSASRWMWSYGMRNKSETTTYVQTFLDDTNAMGQALCFRTDNGGKFTGSSFVELSDVAGIRCESTAPGKPRHNAVVETAIWRVIKGGHAARREIRWLFPSVHLPGSPM